MKTFLKKLLAFAVLLFLFDKLFWVVLSTSNTFEVDRRLEHILDGTLRKDLIVLGSSRGARNVIAGTIGDSLGMSAYNLSYPGSDIEFHLFLLETLVECDASPKVLLLVVDDPAELLPDKTITFRLDRLYPLASLKRINDELIRREDRSILSRAMVLARLNRQNFHLSNLQFTELDSMTRDGSMPIAFRKADPDPVFRDSVGVYDSALESPTKVEAFVRFQELCARQGIQEYIVFSPNYRTPTPGFQERLMGLASKGTVPIVYDSLDPRYTDPAGFHDESHLVTSGAIHFTDAIIRMILAHREPGRP